MKGSIMANNLIGCFYFKQTINGNLIGEFSNNKSPGIYTESSDSLENTGNYLGKYYSTWQENGKPKNAVLEISQKLNTENKIFSLTWRNSKGISVFKGEGMLCDNTLIGDYQESKK